jgi:hypothetical protein
MVSSIFTDALCKGMGAILSCNHFDAHLKIQFHVDNLSSAHIYLRMNEGDSWEAIPQDLLTDCAQLTKANSIEGERMNLSE